MLDTIDMTMSASFSEVIFIIIHYDIKMWGF